MNRYEPKPDGGPPTGTFETGAIETFETGTDVYDTVKREKMWIIVDWLLAIGVFGMLVGIVVQIVGRMIGTPPVWTEELTRLLFMDGVFLGMAGGFRIAAHPRVASLVEKAPGWFGKLSIHLTMACTVFVFSILTWKGMELVLQQIHTNETSPALKISMWVVSVPFVLSALLAIIGTFQALYLDRDLRRRVLAGEVIA